jgi:hypothetical protein
VDRRGLVPQRSAGSTSLRTRLRRHRARAGGAASSKMRREDIEGNDVPAPAPARWEERSRTYALPWTAHREGAGNRPSCSRSVPTRCRRGGESRTAAGVFPGVVRGLPGSWSLPGSWRSHGMGSVTSGRRTTHGDGEQDHGQPDACDQDQEHVISPIRSLDSLVEGLRQAASCLASRVLPTSGCTDQMHRRPRCDREARSALLGTTPARSMTVDGIAIQPPYQCYQCAVRVQRACSDICPVSAASCRRLRARAAAPTLDRSDPVAYNFTLRNLQRFAVIGILRDATNQHGPVLSTPHQTGSS